MLPLSFPEVQQAIRDYPLPPADMVIGIATGGLVPAALIAYELQCDLRIVRFNYRNEANQPIYEYPQLLMPFEATLEPHVRILLVDDVSVSGKTIAQAKALFPSHRITTLVLKGKADHVLFPNIKTCVKWPWKV